jgi:mannose/cellobiose epimerase-like protein (N-acyl-D-glucosamine 2-epimerase family)
MTDTMCVAVSRWLFEDALPFWARNGIDRINGGYIEHLRLDGTISDVEFKRIRVIGRQIYVFSQAALLGWSDGIALARHGYEFLTRNAWLGPEGGWARQLDRRGLVKDPTPDLYDLAFVLFAFGWFYRASGDAEALGWAQRTLDFIESKMRHPRGGFLTGATFDLILDDGTVLDRGLRVWPNCERIQAAVAVFELYNRDPRPVLEQSGKLLLDRFLSHVPRAWIDQFSADGSRKADKIPASTLYHIVVAFAEMLRVKEAVARAFQ